MVLPRCYTRGRMLLTYNVQCALNTVTGMHMLSMGLLLLLLFNTQHVQQC